MFPRRAISRRALGALVPLVLTATLLSGDSVIGQNATDISSITPEESTILPTAKVVVLGDEFLAAPTIAPLRSGPCASSVNGPVERAAARSTDTVVLVDNRSCVGADLLSIGRTQVPGIDADTDVVVVGGIGLEFDWPQLAASCLDQETRSAPRCQEEAGIARATAANTFFAWRSVLQQIHRAAPDANIVLVAPPQPVGSTPLQLGSSCCVPRSNGTEQVRSVFDTSRSLRGAVVESMSDLPIVVVETTDSFEGHRGDDIDPWLTTDRPYAGAPTLEGAAALSGLLDVLMPVGTAIGTPASVPAEVIVVVGSTLDDDQSHNVIADAADFWIETFGLGDLNPSIALVPVATSDLPPPPTTTTTTTTTEAPTPPIAVDSAPVEVGVTAAETNVATPRPAIELQNAVSTFATTGEELAEAIGALETTEGITTIADLAEAISVSSELFTPTVTDRYVVIRAVDLLAEPTSDADIAALRNALNSTDADTTLLADSPEQAQQLEALIGDAPATIQSVEIAALAEALPAPEANAQLIDVSATDVDGVIGIPVELAANIEVSRPTDATVTWMSGDTIIAAGQRATLDPATLSVGEHDVVVTVETEREIVEHSLVVSITSDGDGHDDSCSAFDPFPTDLDADGLAAACDPDDDGDQIPDLLDPCPTTVTTSLHDVDLDGLPDHCDADSLDGPAGDVDADGFPDLIDNCPTTSQSNQFDANANGIGNSCEGNQIVVCTITGTAGDDVLLGTEGNDVICGLGGDDRIVGFDGDDVIFGGAGNDNISGSGGNDSIYGGAGDDIVFGNGDDDLILGEAGNDELSGGFGFDVISGGGGNDVLTGDDGGDIIFGGRGADSIRGGAGPDTIAGDGGDDDILGEAGADILRGGPGADAIGGGRANDILIDVEDTDFVRGGTGDDLIGDTPIRLS